MGKNKIIGTKIEALITGEFPEVLEPFVKNPRCITAIVPDIFSMAIKVPLINNNILLLVTKSMTGQEIPVNSCLLGGDHIVCGDLILPNSEGIKKAKKGQIQEIRGEITLLDFGLIGKSKDIAKKLWEKSEQILKEKDEEMDKMQEDYEEKYQTRIARLQRSVDILQKTIDQQQTQLMTKPQIYQTKMINLIVGVIVREIESTTLNKELQVDLKQIEEEIYEDLGINVKEMSMDEILEIINNQENDIKKELKESIEVKE